MATYEIIWESGEHSLASYDSDEEMFLAVGGQHERAISGEPGGPTGHPALRAVKVLKYSSDPSVANTSLSLDVAKSEMNAMLDEASEDGVVELDRLIAITNRMRSAVVPSGPHESNYKAEADKEFLIEEIVGGK